jgi:CheY-like chemotaxis protein
MAEKYVNPVEFLILVVDDSAQNRLIISHVLESEGFKVENCESGEEALKKLKKYEPDLILLDIMMPGMSGYEVGTRVQKSIFKETPIIFLSSLKESLDKVRAFEAGAVDFVTKPFDKEELIARVRTHLMLRVLQKERKEQIRILKDRELELSMANKKKDELMRMLSHDIKNPLSGILGLVQILKSDHSLSEDDKNNMLSLIIESSEKLHQIVKDVLDKEVLAQKAKSSKIEKVDIVHLIESVITEFTPKATLKKIRLSFYSNKKDIHAYVNPQQFMWCLQQLVQLSLKFTRSEDSISIIIEQDSHDKFIVKIADTGVGLPVKHIPNYFLNKELPLEDGEIENLELDINFNQLKDILKAHNGNMWINTVTEVGTTFFVEIPVGLNR